MIRVKKESVHFSIENHSTITYRKVDLIQKNLFLIAGIGLLLGTVVSMIGDVFPVLVKGGIAHFYWVIIEFLLCFLTYGVGFPMLEKKLFKGKHWNRLIVVAVGAGMFFLFCLRYYRSVEIKMEMGFAELGRTYVNLFNMYYRTNFHLFGGDAKEIPLAMGLCLLIIVFAGWNLAYLFRKHTLWICFPVVTVIAFLAVGKSPSYRTIAYLVLGILAIGLYRSYGQDAKAKEVVGKRVSRIESGEGFYLPNILIFIVIFCILLMVPSYNEYRVERLMRKCGETKELQEKLEKRVVAAVTSIPTMTIVGNRELINNRKPEFSGQKLMVITTEEKPLLHLYLRSYLGMNYGGGSWGYDDHLSVEALKAGVKEKDLVELLQNGVYENLLNWNKASNQDLKSIQYQLKYKVGAGESALMPYYALMSEKQVKYVEDVLPKKNVSVGSLTVLAANTNQLTAQSFEQLQKRMEYDGNDKLWDFYDEYVRKYYLEDTREVAAAARIARQFSGSYDDGTLWGRNLRRLTLAYKVQQYLSDYEYSMELDQIWDGTDSVQYMLTTGKKGYCVHFATAGTLMLRALDVPARYVSGYVMSGSDFVRQDDGTYEYTLLDEQAHAWVEIYLDHMGWFPIEMTPGYGQSVSGLEQYWNVTQDQIIEEPSVTKPGQSVVPTPVPTQKPEETMAPNETQQPAETEGPEVTPTPSVTPSPQNPSQTKAPAGNGGQSGNGDLEDGAYPSIGEEEEKGAFVRALGKILKVFFLVVAVVGAVVGVLYVIYRKDQRERRALAGLFKKKYYARAVKKIYQRMVRKLKRTGKLHKLSPSDPEVCRVLMEVYPDIPKADWTTFMEYVKEASFSGREIDGEKAQFCRDLMKRTTEAGR